MILILMAYAALALSARCVYPSALVPRYRGVDACHYHRFVWNLAWEFDGNTMYIAHKTRYSALDNLMAFHRSYEWAGSQYIGREK